MLNIVLYQPRIPQNTGNVARSCFVTGSRLHLVGPMGFRIDEAKLRRAGLTYWHQTDIVTYESWEEFLEKNAGSRMILMTSHATKLHSQFQFEDGDYIVFGREDAGVPDAVHAQFGERQFDPERGGALFQSGDERGDRADGSGASAGLSGAGVRRTRNDHDLRKNCRGYSLL